MTAFGEIRASTSEQTCHRVPAYTLRTTIRNMAVVPERGLRTPLNVQGRCHVWRPRVGDTVACDVRLMIDSLVERPYGVAWHHVDRRYVLFASVWAAHTEPSARR